MCINDCFTDKDKYLETSEFANDKTRRLTNSFKMLVNFPVYILRVRWDFHFADLCPVYYINLWMTCFRKLWKFHFVKENNDLYEGKITLI